MQQYEIQRPNNPVVELSNLGFTKPAFLASLFEMKTSPDVMSILPSQVRQLPLLKANAFVNLTETYQKSPYNEFPENYKRICQCKSFFTSGDIESIYRQRLCNKFYNACTSSEVYIQC
ncbi:hypothetical protein BC829DRAFT_61050 [Chytridium lagenaria]|nr:hypothetical protein BC829DRAFT_61050 [Chytridium lagenaria]